MAYLRRVANLSAEDFPGVNAEKFYEWRAAKLRVHRNWKIFLTVLVVVGGALVPELGYLVLPIALLPLAVVFYLNAKPGRLAALLERELRLHQRSFARKR